MGLDDILDEYFPGKREADEKRASRRPARAVPVQPLQPAPATPAAGPVIPLAKRPEALELSAKLAEALAPEPAPEPPQRLILPVGLHVGVSHDDYCRDPGERPSLSSSVATTLATRAPLHGWHKHPRLGGGDDDAPTAAQGRGSILHKLLLGEGQEIAVFDFDDFKKEAARNARDAAIAAGQIPIVREKFEPLEETARVILRRLADRGIVLSGQSEVTGIWEKDGVLCRLRADHLIVADSVDIIDIKTSTNVAPEKMVADFVEWGDDVQHACYTEGIAALIPEMVGRIRMRFVFCEADPPNDVIVYDPPGDMRELGARRWKRGRAVWKRCLETYGEKTEWPGYSLAPVKLGPPAWVITRDTEIQANRMENDNGKLPF